MQVLTEFKGHFMPMIHPYFPSIQAVPAQVAKQMQGISYKPGCPIPVKQLAYLTLPYYGPDHKTHVGHLIINRHLAKETVSIFETLYHKKFVIVQMKPYSTYGIGQYASHNDTVGFYCRPDQGNTKQWSKHAYGIAIDINPLWNPYIEIGHQPWPKGSAYYLKHPPKQGAIKLGGPVFTTFTQRGWLWGGIWHDKDMMHFQKMMNGYYVVDKMSLIPKNQRIRELNN